MGKVTRSPEEEAARGERKRELARERARRRRANPEARARDREAMRKQRAEDPELRAREAKAKRERMATKPESRARQVEAQRRYEDAHREERKEAKRRRRNTEPGLRVLEAFQCRRRGSSFDEEKMCFDNSLSRLSSVRNEEQHLCVASSTSVADLSVCKTCKDSLLSGTMPPLSKMTLAASAALSSMDTDVFCSQSTQASITTSSIGIQCAVGFLISSSSQTYEECPGAGWSAVHCEPHRSHSRALQSAGAHHGRIRGLCSLRPWRGWKSLPPHRAWRRTAPRLFHQAARHTSPAPAAHSLAAQARQLSMEGRVTPACPVGSTASRLVV